MIAIGPHHIDSHCILAPMAGVSDRPFRQLCRHFGAGLAVSEMVTSDSRLWHTRKSRHRVDLTGEPGPRSVQIAGSEPAMMAQAARYNVEQGAEIIDINMGCPAKKVCRKAAGSALLRDEALVEAILRAVVTAVAVPVTLKIRTGWAPEHRNGVRVAQIAEHCGIAALAVHGRTRQCRFAGTAEYDTIAAIKQAVSLPVFANGDIDSPQKASQVLRHTGADAVMIGRAAQGRPWLFREIEHYLRTGTLLAPPTPIEIREVLLHHLDALHTFYGPEHGIKIARKHIAWYLQHCTQEQAAKEFKQHFNQIASADEQCDALKEFLALPGTDVTPDSHEHGYFAEVTAA